MVSIIIPVRFRPDLTQVCLDSILHYTEDNELILVQEGEDEKITALLKSYENIKIIQNKIPKGYAGALNDGMKIAQGDYYCFMNNDVVVIPRWLDAMLETFEDKEVGLVSPTFGETKSIQHINYNHGQEFDYVNDPLLLMGVCFLIKREVMDKIGCWDESFGLGGGEDNDICIRIHEAGYKLVVARKSYIYHYCGASFRKLFNNDPNIFKTVALNQFKIIKSKYGDKYNADHSNYSS